MTDATAGRSGVGIRLYVAGGEVVKRTFDQVGDSGKKMWAEIALGERAANPAVRALSLGAGEAKQGFEGLAARVGPAGTALSAFGFAGLAVAATLGGLAVALVKVRDGMAFAAELTDVSDRIGIGAESLQEWRYVADEAGVSVESLQGNMEKLNGVVGAFKAGIGDAKLKPVFEELGITKAQLQNVSTADDMLILLADTLGQVKDRATQVKFARTLGVEEALPIIRLGSERIRELSNEARDLGLVMSDDVRAKFDEADRAMERAQQRIEMALKVAVVDLADDFAGLVENIADAIQWLSRLDSAMDNYRIDDNPATRAGMWVNRRVRDLAAGRNAAESEARWHPLGSDILDRLAMFRTRPGEVWNEGGGFDPKGHSGKSSSSAANKAAREAEQRRERAERAQQQQERLNDDLARSVSLGNLSINDKASNEIADLELERAARLREIARSEQEYIRSKGLRGLTEAEAEQLRVSQEELHLKKKDIIDWNRRRELAARRMKDDEDAARSATELLDIDAQMVRTQAERHRIEREILLATIEIARKRKAFELENDPELDDQQRGQQMAIFNRGASRRVELFDHQETERLRAQFKSYGREVTEAIREGRIGEYIGDQLKQRLLDGALDQLFNLFNGMKSGAGGAAGGGAGSWLSSAFNVAKSFFGGGRAAGGGAEAGRFYHTVEHGRPELFMIGGSGHVTSAVETARMLRETMAETSGGSSRVSGPPIVHQTLKFDNRGAVMTSDLLQNMEEMSASSATASVAASRETVPTDMARRQRYTLNRRR
ncbi:hypothetical protein [Brevundimonas sp.]|uniref:hypothetical protein n=1 Tax=Brevundimonas sp. TaxID=1871086 RepID=UPI00289AF858|nr:hypothetical protein [Brevundimonas sp.]